MASIQKKQYGLIIKKENASLSTEPKVIAAFADDEEETIDTQVMSSENVSASTMRIRMQAKREYERAMAEDPSVFQYDEIYENLQAVKDAKQAEQKTADKERKPKYVLQLLKAHQKRKVEQQLRDERKQEKEREAEGEMYKDKEVFVTGAYRKQMEEAQELGKELAMQDRIDELTAVEKQKFWQAGFHRTVLHNISRDVEVDPSTSKAFEIKAEIIEEDDQAAANHAEKLKSLRRQVVAYEKDVLPAFKDKDIKSELKSERSKLKDKKSIYSDDTEDELPPEKTEVKLKPGLNILSRAKKLTKAEQLRNRFTPSDSESDVEAKRDQRKHRRKRSDTPDERNHFKERSTSSRQRRRSKSGERKRKKRSGSYGNERKDKRGENDKKIESRKKDQNQKENRHKRRHDSPVRRNSRDEKSERKRSPSRVEDSGEKHTRKESNRHPEKKSNKTDFPKPKEMKIIAKPRTKEERLEGLKQILKQRNGESEIAEYRKRYLERKESGFVTLPL